MSGANIVLARVDDRLIHGQVVVKWLRARPCDQILISDDEVSQDQFLQRVLALAAPKGVHVVAKSVDQTVDYLENGAAGQRVMLLLRQPETAARLVDRGLSLPALNVGGQAPAPGSQRIYKSVALSADQMRSLGQLADAGTRVYFQSVPEPEASAVEWNEIRQWALAR